MSDLNVCQRLSLCKKLVGESSFKKVKGEGLKFSYLPIDQVKPVVEDAMNQAGLVFLFSDVDTWAIRESWATVTHYPGGDSKSTWFHLGGRMDITIINIDNPSDRLVFTFSGEAKDNSDKTISKLYTSIIKNAYKQIFNISDTPKDDVDNTEDEVAEEKAQEEARKEEAKRLNREKALRDPFYRAKLQEAEAKAATLPTEIDETWPTVLQRPLDVKLNAILTHLRSAAMWEKLSPIFAQFNHPEADRMAILRKDHTKLDSIEFVNALYEVIAAEGKEGTQ